MAKRKKKAPESAGGGWISTFADLMNLLLCFFVLLFSMSTVDADKYEQIVTSLSESIDIFSGGGKAISEGTMVSSGAAQMSIDEYFDEFKNSGKSQNPGDSETDHSKDKISEDGQNQSHKKDGAEENQSNQQNTEKMTESQKEEYEKAKKNELKKKTEELYEEVVEKTENKKIQDMVNVVMDENYQYVQIRMNGAILFDSGADTIKASAVKIMSQVGDILKIYDDHMIKIEGHTDNVPISGGRFENNMWLSTARATRVFEYFVNKKKLNPKTLETTGRSEYEPIASNKTDKGRSRNRRVEIKIYTEKEKTGGKS